MPHTEELALHVEQANPVRWHDSYFPAGGCCAVAGPELGGTQRTDRQSGSARVVHHSKSTLSAVREPLTWIFRLMLVRGLLKGIEMKKMWLFMTIGLLMAWALAGCGLLSGKQDSAAMDRTEISAEPSQQISEEHARKVHPRLAGGKPGYMW